MKHINYLKCFHLYNSLHLSMNLMPIILKQNYFLMNNLNAFDSFGLPILVGISRKSMIYKLLNTNAQQALNGTTMLNTIALMNGADILRVHDVKNAVELKKTFIFADR